MFHDRTVYKEKENHAFAQKALIYWGLASVISFFDKFGGYLIKRKQTNIFHTRNFG